MEVPNAAGKLRVALRLGGKAIAFGEATLEKEVGPMFFFSFEEVFLLEKLKVFLDFTKKRKTNLHKAWLF